MRTIGIIGAMEEEISFLREKMDIVTTKSVVGLTYYVGRYEGNNVVLVKSWHRQSQRRSLHTGND